MNLVILFVKKQAKSILSQFFELNINDSNFAILYIFSDRGKTLFSFAGVAYIHQRQQKINYKIFEKYCILSYYF